MYCRVQFFFPASIRCVSPSSDIRFDITVAIAREYFAQSFFILPNLGCLRYVPQTCAKHLVCHCIPLFKPHHIYQLYKIIIRPNIQFFRVLDKRKYSNAEPKTWKYMMEHKGDWLSIRLIKFYLLYPDYIHKALS